MMTRVHFTTSAISGAIILGYTRRDRNIRLSFSAGDFMYSIGRKEEPGKTDKVYFSLSGLWQREGHLSGSRPRHRFKFKKPTSYFRLRVRVIGPTLQIFVQDKPIFSYTTPDLSPIEGALGCAMNHGAVRLQYPLICRLDRPLIQGNSPSDLLGLDLSKETNENISALIGRPTKGIPLSLHGTIIILLPQGKTDDSLPSLMDHALMALRKLRGDSLAHPQHWILALPSGLDSETAKMTTWPTGELNPKMQSIIRHNVKQPFTEKAWVLFVDSHGVLRAGVAIDKKGRKPHVIAKWARFYRSK